MRRRIFLPMTRVTAVDAGQVITTGLVNMRRFEQRPAETLVLGELLDRQVDARRDRRDGHRPRRRHGADPHPRLAGHQVHVRKSAPGRLPAARRHASPSTGTRSAASRSPRRTRARRTCWRPSRSCARPTSRTCCTSCRPSAGPRSPQPSTTSGSPTSSRSCPRTTRSRSSACSPRSAPPTCSRRWPPTTPPTCSASCRPEQAEQLLELMEPDEADDVRRLLSYDEYTAGGMMTTEPVVLSHRRDRGRGAGPGAQPRPVARARRPGLRLPPAARDPDRALRRGRATSSGCCASRRPRWCPASATPTSSRSRPDATLPEVTTYLATYNLVAAPVVDDDDHLLGAVTDRRRPRPPAARGLARARRRRTDGVRGPGRARHGA